MSVWDVITAMLAGLGVAFLVLLVVGVARAISEWKYQKAREKQYADEWVRKHRSYGDPSPFPDRRRQGGA